MMRIIRGSSRSHATGLLFVAFFTLSSPPPAICDEIKPDDAQFRGASALQMIFGKRVATNCAVNWQSEDGKYYCFSSDDEKTAFLKDTDGNLVKAKEGYTAFDIDAMDNEMARFGADDVSSFIQEHIKSAGDKSSGLFVVDDAVEGQSLPLKFEKVDFVRTIHGYGFFPDVVFTSRDEPAKKYLVDFWVRPELGKLTIVDTRIYKAPTKEGDTWVSVTRSPKPWWWIPASEHPGKSEVKRSWEVMSSLDDHIAQELKKDGGHYKLKDDKTGEILNLDFIGIHQPVRKLKGDGKFFACTDFRKAGSKDEFYDIDFWMDEKTGKITVDEVRVHKVPVLTDGNFVQIPRYNFDPKTFDVVP
jgi:hypothetical protein